MALGSTSGSGDEVSPDPHTTTIYGYGYIADLQYAVRRLEQVMHPTRRDHPSTPAAINVALDDINDTVARLRDLL